MAVSLVLKEFQFIKAFQVTSHYKMQKELLSTDLKQKKNIHNTIKKGIIIVVIKIKEITKIRSLFC